MESCYKPGCLISALQQSTTAGCDHMGYKSDLAKSRCAVLLQLVSMAAGLDMSDLLILLRYCLHCLHSATWDVPQSLSLSAQVNNGLFSLPTTPDCSHFLSELPMQRHSAFLFIL